MGEKKRREAAFRAANPNVGGDIMGLRIRPRTNARTRKEAERKRQIFLPVAKGSAPLRAHEIDRVFTDARAAKTAGVKTPIGVGGPLSDIVAEPAKMTPLEATRKILLAMKENRPGDVNADLIRMAGRPAQLRLAAVGKLPLHEQADVLAAWLDAIESAGTEEELSAPLEGFDVRGPDARVEVMDGPSAGGRSPRHA